MTAPHVLDVGMASVRVSESAHEQYCKMEIQDAWWRGHFQGSLSLAEGMILMGLRDLGDGLAMAGEVRQSAWFAPHMLGEPDSSA